MTNVGAYHVNFSTPGYVEWAVNNPSSASPNAIQGTKARLVNIKYNIQVHAGSRNVTHVKCRMIWYVRKQGSTLSGVATLPNILVGPLAIDAQPATHESDNYHIIADKQFTLTPAAAVFQSGGGLAPAKTMRFTIKVPKKYQLQEYDAAIGGTSKNQICFLMLSNQPTTGSGLVPYVVQDGTQRLTIVDQE